MTLTIPSFQLSSIGPWLTLTVTAILILVLDALPPKRGRLLLLVWPWRAWRWPAFQTIGLWGKTGTGLRPHGLSWTTSPASST